MEKRERVEDDASTEPSKRIKVEAGLSPLIQPSGQPLAVSCAMKVVVSTTFR